MANEPTTADLRANRPAAATTEDKKYIGVPDGFTARRRGFAGEGEDDRRFPRMREYEVPPTFMDGDEYRLASQPPETIARIQQRLANAGLLDSFRIGLFDEKTRAAYRNVLEYANIRGYSDDAQALAELESNPVFKPEEVKAPPAYKISNPATLRRRLKALAKDALGSGNALSEDQMQSIISAFQGQELAVQKRADTVSEMGGVVTEGQDFDTFAEEKVVAADPKRADSRKVIAGLSTVFDMLGGAQ